MDHPIRVLVVEDSEVYARLLASSLEGVEMGPNRFDVTAVGDLSEIPEGRFWDVSLLDLNLKTTSGVDTVRAYRDRFPSTPCVVVTAEDGCDVEDSCLAEGASSFLRKGSTEKIDVLSAVIKAIYAERRRVRRLYECGELTRMVLTRMDQMLKHLSAAAIALDKAGVKHGA